MKLLRNVAPKFQLLHFTKVTTAIDISLAGLALAIAAVLFVSYGDANVAFAFVFVAVYFALQNLATFLIPHIPRLPRVVLLFLRLARVWQLYIILLAININGRLTPWWNFVILGPVVVALLVHGLQWKLGLPVLLVNRFEEMAHANRPKYKINFLFAFCLVANFNVLFGNFATFSATPNWPENYWMILAMATIIALWIALFWVWVWKAKDTKKWAYSSAWQNDNAANN